jgi:hypothetical protein
MTLRGRWRRLAQRQLKAARVKSDHHTTSSSQRLKSALATLTTAALLVSTSHAGDAKKMLEKSVIEPEPAGPKVNVLLNVEFADKYVTPRGQIVRDDGLTIQPLLLAFISLYESDTSFISSFKLVGGVWNDFGSKGVSEHAPFGTNPKTHYTEIDPILGVEFGFLKKFTLDVTYTSFVEQILDIQTSHHLETKLSFDDSSILGAFALHPYVSYWKELEGKSTAARVPFAVFGKSPNTGSATPPDEGYYFEVGVSPGFTLKQLGDLKIEFPCRVLFPSSDFYGEWYDDKSTVGLYEVGAKASIPLNFMPKGYGHWSAHVGYKYMNFVDNNLSGMNQFNAPGKSEDDVHQVYGGISVFF